MSSPSWATSTSSSTPCPSSSSTATGSSPTRSTDRACNVTLGEPWCDSASTAGQPRVGRLRGDKPCLRARPDHPGVRSMVGPLRRAVPHPLGRRPRLQDTGGLSLAALCADHHSPVRAARALLPKSNGAGTARYRLLNPLAWYCSRSDPPFRSIDHLRQRPVRYGPRNGRTALLPARTLLSPGATS